MNQITPIPIFIHSEPDRCPKCKNIENKKTVCRSCGYEYKDEESDSFVTVILTIITSAIILGWVLVTLIEWFTGTPLFEVFQNQFDWITGLRLR